MRNGVTIRPALPKEAAALTALVEAAYGHYVARIGRRPGPMEDDYAAQPDALLLDNVAVAPEAQGRGIGRALIAFAEAEARRRGHRQIRLYTHVLMTENIALYTRLGFAETGRVSEKGFQRVYMEKPLPR